MTSLISKIEQLIKREKTTPERKTKDDSKKSSNEILSELFGAFNAAPPKIDDATLKKSKKSKKKHKKDKKKRSRSNSSNNSDDSEYSHKRKKKKKNKSKKRKEPSRSRSSSGCRTPLIENYDGSRTPDLKDCDGSRTPVIIKREPEPIKVKSESRQVKSEYIKDTIKTESKEEFKPTTVKQEDSNDCDVSFNTIDASLIPMPEDLKLEPDDLRHKLESKKCDSGVEVEKCKSKIQIKNLKFSTVFEETVKKAEEEARKRAEKYEEGEYTDSSSSSVKEVESNSTFPKSSDPGGILRKLAAAEESKLAEDAKNLKKRKHSESSHKSSKRDRSRSKRSTSRSKRSRSRSGTRRRRRRSHSRSRKSSRHRSSSRSKRRSSSRSRTKPRTHSPRHRGRRSRSPSGVKLGDSEKKRLLEVARRNAINMLKNGAVPAGAAALPPHTRNQVMAAIQSGGKSVDELTDFCKHLSKKEALGELSSVSSNDEGISENEDTIAFHHPFMVKEKAPIVMNIRGGAPLPLKTALAPVANKDELRLQFPVSSGSQHREKASEWVPVSPKKDNMQVAKINGSTPAPKPTAEITKSAPLAIEAPPPPASSQPAYLNSFTSGTQLSSVPALPAPGPQAYPPGIDPASEDMSSIVTQKLSLIRKEQEENELALCTVGFGWSKDNSLGQFTGTTGAQILTPRELASGTQAWAKKDQLVRAAPVEGGMGMHLLQKMGWTPGRGLGKEGTGTLQPLLLEVKLDTRGLQAKEEIPGRNKMIRGQRQGRRGPAPLVAGGKHPVSLLGEYCSKHKLGPPEYTLCFECGPDHKKNFLFKYNSSHVCGMTKESSFFAGPNTQWLSFNPRSY